MRKTLLPDPLSCLSPQPKNELPVIFRLERVKGIEPSS
jgi:hypothetical protein